MFSRRYLVNKPLSDIEEMLVVQSFKDQVAAEKANSVGVKTSSGETLNEGVKKPNEPNSGSESHSEDEPQVVDEEKQLLRDF